MNQHSRQIVAADELPPTDSAADIEAISKTEDGEAFDPTTGELIGSQPTQTEAAPAAEPQAAPEASAVAPQSEAVDGIDPETDIALVVSRGHVHLARAQHISALFEPIAYAAAFVGVISVIGAVLGAFANSKFGMILQWVQVGLLVLCGLVFVGRWWKSRSVLVGPFILVAVIGVIALNIASNQARGWVAGGFGLSSLFTFDRDTYFDLGGGLRGGPEYRWMTDYKPKPESLSVAEYGRLTAALSKDIAAKSMEAAEWSNVAELVKAPIVTRGEKAIIEHGEKLKAGVIVVPRDLRIAAVLAHVEGKWSAAVVGGGNCTVILGPVPEGCRDNNNPKGWQHGDFATLIERFGIVTAKAEQE